ncbi:MAG: biotin--[acetyl-CoA-carboxylase] ligase [Bacillota bacterium]|nr:biotin--[acetyl-CoA-carboxylase] ligase [Bacillota bacterium]
MVKDEVLRILEENRGSLISGGALSKTLDVSRTAVWKAVSALKEEGFEIDILKSSGYRLTPECDKPSEAGIGRYLKTDALGREMSVFHSIPSTNLHLRKLAEGGSGHGCTVIADLQTKGRGRMSRSFFSPPEGIYMSILFRPQNTGIIPQLITIAAAVSVAEAVDSVCGVSTSIKWVNDIFIDGKKVCGILTEGSVEAESGAYFYLISGIGINVHKPKDGYPEELKDIAAAVDETAVKAFTKNQLIAEVLNRFEEVYLSLSEEASISALIERYRRKLFILNKKITVKSASGSYPAVALDINDKGNLLVKKEDGTEALLSSGEISIRI